MKKIALSCQRQNSRMTVLDAPQVRPEGERHGWRELTLASSQSILFFWIPAWAGTVLLILSLLFANIAMAAMATTESTVDHFKVATILKPNKKLTPFSLIATDHKPFTESSFIGKWTLLFFGYASCPEICPKALMTFRDVFKLLPHQSAQVQPLKFVFVSLDPKTDKPEHLKLFLDRFNSEFIGLTGEEKVIEQLSQSCSVYSWQDPEASPNAPKMIDHSATLLLINPQGRIQAVFTSPHNAKAIADDLKQILSYP